MKRLLAPAALATSMLTQSVPQAAAGDVVLRLKTVHEGIATEYVQEGYDAAMCLRNANFFASFWKKGAPDKIVQSLCKNITDPSQSKCLVFNNMTGHFTLAEETTNAACITK